VSRSCLSSLLLPLVGAVLIAASPALAQTSSTNAKSTDTKRSETKAETKSKAHRAPATLDLSTPNVMQRRVVTHGGQRSQDAAMKKPSLGSVDFGDGELRLDGGRKSRDVAHVVTGFDQTPGSATFRQLAPSLKSGTPPYVGFTFSRPNN
jgi:hypothetical protein